ncbi:MAG: hypothetical protein Q9208_008418 [Pyrenodesmia sp. 3 TL-2023]
MAQVLVRPTVKRKLHQPVPNTAAPVTAQRTDVQQRFEVEQQQSFQYVHALLHSSLAHLAYLRHLFPDACFKDTTFDAVCEDAEKAYRDWAGAEHSRKKHKSHATPTENDGASEPQQDLKVLVAGSHPGVNIFLSWLNGILQGIRKGTLTTAQFSVFPDPTNQAKVIESYRFSFQYNESVDHPAAQLTGLTISAASQTSVSVKSIRCGLIELLRLVSSYTEKMPDLPGKVLSLAGQSCLQGPAPAID